MNYCQAEWYDAVAQEYWRETKPLLLDVLQPWSGETGLAADIGAGTGLTTQLLATVCRGEVLACEPEEAMRVGIMSKIAGEDDMRRRVTIAPWTVHDLVRTVDEPITLITAISMIDHLLPSERAELLQWAAAHLIPKGALIIGPYEDTGAPNTRDNGVTTPMQDEKLGNCYTSEYVGRFRYEGWAKLDDSHQHTRWLMTWQLYEGDSLLEQRSSDFIVYPTSRQELINQAEDAGLVARSDGTFVVLQPQIEVS
ncbi:class I SAM-dependent methyltransferase [Corynebacterium anserum]|uniref:Methyltransferase domain-containing protein n=1 Tax=Corynebacterium anserum TaxID=2684406 RepID=A0A7G7YNE5_9CORY|nr:class I SAM-dependent methyltransferase [Corynebacterium anserum]MBC2681576.1 methyltransferase domain-containing protein [Corynebacterium anserum]QNH96015.1 methyltransferase domain-containing protein [Corynebacterium anserum]